MTPSSAVADYLRPIAKKERRPKTLRIGASSASYEGTTQGYAEIAGVDRSGATTGALERLFRTDEWVSRLRQVRRRAVRKGRTVSIEKFIVGRVHSKRA